MLVERGASWQIFIHLKLKCQTCVFAKRRVAFAVCSCSWVELLVDCFIYNVKRSVWRGLARGLCGDSLLERSVGQWGTHTVVESSPHFCRRGGNLHSRHWKHSKAFGVLQLKERRTAGPPDDLLWIYLNNLLGAQSQISARSELIIRLAGWFRLARLPLANPFPVCRP